MTPTPEKIKAAIAVELSWVDHLELAAKEHAKTVLFALRFTEKMMGEPSIEILRELYEPGQNLLQELAFKAMVFAAIAEIQEEMG